MRPLRYIRDWLVDCMEAITPGAIVFSILGTAAIVIVILWQVS